MTITAPASRPAPRERSRRKARPLTRAGAYLLLAFGALLTLAPFYFIFVFATPDRAGVAPAGT